MLKNCTVFATALFLCLFVIGCGGSSQDVVPTPTITQVTVSPVNPTVVAGATLQFTATVYGTGNYDHTVTWAVEGVVGGNSTVGTITAGGLYTAPASAPATCTITATSTASPTKAGSTQVSIAAGIVTDVAVTPTNPSIYAGDTQQFTATVTGQGTYDHAVTWAVEGVTGGNSTVGTITTAGLYTAPSPAPASVTVSAKSIADPTKAGSTEVSIAAAVVTQVSVAPVNPSIMAGSTQQFTATVSGLGGFDQRVTWAVEGVAGGNQTVGTITAAGLYTAPSPAPTTVNITATSMADATKTGTTHVTITAAAPTGPALAVDAAAARHPISPLIYGMNAYSLNSETMAGAVRLSVDRWGGDAATRYNYLLDVYNSAADWYFETNPNGNNNYPNVSEFNSQVERDRRTHSLTVATVPLIGWATRRVRACSYSVAKYGAQKEVDPWNSDCGKGVRLDGSQITADPNDTSTPIGPDFAGQWVTYLVNRYGTAQNGGIAIYSLDNEPEYWQWVHSDVHPKPNGYDDFAQLGLAYAAAIKQSDPTALVTGPVISDWYGYFYSPVDWISGWSSPPNYDRVGNPVDRIAHGNVPFIEWYLQQFAAYEQQHGKRLLDYLDVHAYFAPDAVQFQPAGDASVQQMRLDATRLFWDPTYKGKMNDYPQLIPRMRDWVARNYPGTRLAITEYNFGALDHINGALAQADLLGIFGREGLDMATIWGPPDNNTPGMYAFKIYRNYDNAGGAFGETSVSAISADQGKLSVYAAERVSDGALTVMVINKTSGDLSSTITISNFAAKPAAKAYRYSSANLNSIVALPDQPLNANSLTAPFPASSITFFVVPK